MLEQLLAQHPPRLFLDLGCGDGILSHYLMDRFPHSQAVLVDFSGPMLEKAGQR
nr:class I SAM-dependent methyltransferase [Polycladomyces sp. WAk]